MAYIEDSEHRDYMADIMETNHDNSPISTDITNAFHPDGDNMNLYFAPLDGITGYIYRNTHAELFGGCDA